jgi:DNA invertase Pin-like site-specific DNA recombinase
MTVQVIPSPALRCANYYRVSTDEQGSLPMQLQICRHYAADHGWIVIAELQDI